MKRSAICIAAGMLCAAGAHAQSNVTIYGVVDAFVEYGKAGTTAAPATIWRQQSGGLNGSRIGFKGSEDLGGGLSANFVLEHGLLLDTGLPASASSFWNRQSYVGLNGAYGAIRLGRQYSPLLVQQDTFDPALSTTGYGSAYNSGVMRTVSRVNNSIVYNSPVVNGFSGSAMYGFGETTVGSSYGSILSASVKYATGPIGAGFAFLKQNKADTTKEDKTIWNLSGSYTVGDLQIRGAVQGTKNDSQALNTEDDRNEFLLGAVYTFGASQVRASFGQAKVKHVDDTTVRHVSLGYVYNLSKNTAVFAAVQAIDNPDNLAYRTSGYTFDAIADGIPAGAGVTARAVAFGLRQRF